MAGIYQSVGEPTEVYLTQPNPFNAVRLDTNLSEPVDAAPDIVAKLKAFYNANPTLALGVIGIGIYLLFIKDKK